MANTPWHCYTIPWQICHDLVIFSRLPFHTGSTLAPFHTFGVLIHILSGKAKTLPYNPRLNSAKFLQRRTCLKNRSNCEGKACDPTSQGSKREAAAGPRDEIGNTLEQTIHAFASALTLTELGQTVRNLLDGKRSDK
jgi:hypothetical protein